MKDCPFCGEIPDTMYPPDSLITPNPVRCRCGAEQRDIPEWNARAYKVSPLKLLATDAETTPITDASSYKKDEEGRDEET